VVAQVRNPLMPVLVAAAVLTVATGDWTDARVIVLVIVVNTAVGIWLRRIAGSKPPASPSDQTQYAAWVPASNW
jgi:magnesium-transporting ATPase (P-type)